MNIAVLNSKTVFIVLKQGEHSFLNEQENSKKMESQFSIEELDRGAKVPHSLSVSREEHPVSGGNPEAPDYYEKVHMTDTFTVQSTDWKAAILRVGTAACAILVV